MSDIQNLVQAVISRLPSGTKAHKQARAVVALAGAPASGKSTLANDLAAALTQAGWRAQVLPMDGFHLDNRLLEARGLLPRKGAPDTFDCAGFAALCARLKTDPNIVHPLFDRSRDIAIAGAGWIGADCDTVVIEGNYLLYDAEGWRDLRPYWDVAIRLDVPEQELRSRLMARWRHYGLTEAEACDRVDGNDLPNARQVAAHALAPDLIWPEPVRTT